LRQQDINKEKEHFEKNDWYKIGGSEEMDPDSINLYLQDLISRTRLNKNSKVLEIACGGGQFGIALIKKIGVNYTGLDLAPSLIEDANTRARAQRVKATFIVGDANSLPFDSNIFDAVFVTYSLHHFPSEESLDKVTAEAHRVLKDGCFYYTLEPNGLNPVVFIWWFINSPERVLPLGIKWRENRFLSINETIIYPWQVKKSLRKKFLEVGVYHLGFIPKIKWFKKNEEFWNKIGKIFEEIPLINKFSGSFVVIGKK